MSQSCVFCRIVLGELPSSLVYQDEWAMAFLDLHPVNEGHVLVVPRRHSERFTQLSDAEAGHLMKVGRRVLRAMEACGIPCEGANLFLSDGEVAGQEVPHAHLHIAPRFKGDGQRVGFVHADPDKFPRARLDEIAERIKGRIEPFETATELVRRFWGLFSDQKWDQAEQLLHSGFVAVWPQSRERMVGAKNFVDVNRYYPGNFKIEVTHAYEIPGGEVSKVLTTVWIEGDTGQKTFANSIFDVRDGEILRAEEYWAEPYAAPEWRRKWVELY